MDNERPASRKESIKTTTTLISQTTGVCHIQHFTAYNYEAMTLLDRDPGRCVGRGRKDRCRTCRRVVVMRHSNELSFPSSLLFLLQIALVVNLILVTLNSSSVLHVHHSVSAFSPVVTNLPRISSATTTAAAFPINCCRPLTRQRRQKFGGNDSPNYAGHFSSSPSTTALASTPSLVAVGTAGLAAVAKFYKAFPLVAGFLTASTKAAFADSMAQYRDVCTTEFNVKRNLSMVLYSGVVLGISCEVMYNKIFPILFPTTGCTTAAAAAAAGGSAAASKYVIRAIKMTLFDGFINAPFLWLPPAYIAQALVYRYPKRDALLKYWVDVKENGLLKKYWSLWLPASFCNFMVVPPHFRVAFVAAVSFFWMIILSIVANNRDSDDIDAAKESCPVEPEPRLLNPRAMD
mmetsp:Transcript_1196/g.2599  ORF Transcript_1196/g.2599 Transcript_1196/m.2599 type:complete len:404 (-) Transcript_1196:83-1294(-)